MKIDTVLEAITDSGGIVSTVAKKLGVSWGTARKYIQSWPETVQAFEDETEKILDMAESVLYSSIREGSSQDAKWILATKGKRRGFSEKHEIQHSGELDSTVRIEVVSADS